MAAFLEIYLPGLRQAAEMFRRAPQVASEELLAAVTEADLLLEREAKEATSTGASGGGAGGLRGSIFHQEQVSESGVIGMVATPMNYAEPVELGTRPHFPPIESLIDWVMVKLGVPEKDARSVAFLVARKISRKGTDEQRMFTRTAQAQQPAVEGIFGRAVDRFTARLAGNA